MKQSGFTLIEILIALGGMVILALAATNFLFSILSQRDQAVAEAMAVDQAESINVFVGGLVRSAQTIVVGADGKSLGLKGENDCWLVQINDSEQSLNTGVSQGTDCQIPGAATQRLSSQRVQVTNAVFVLSSSDSSSRSVSFNWTVAVARPFWQLSQDHSQVFVNLVDSGGS